MSSGCSARSSEATFVLLGLVTLWASVVGVRRHRPSLRWPWRLLTAALLLFLVGGAVRQALGTFGDLSPGRSLLPDYVALVGYCLTASAVLGFVRARWQGRGHDVDAVLDSAVAALGALAVAWVYLITPALFRHDIPVHVRLSLAIYPPFSVFLAAVSARVAFAAGMRPGFAQRLFLGAMVLMLVGDVVHTLADAHLVDIPAQLIEVPYALAFLAIGVTFLHPTMRELTEPVPSDQVAPTRGRLAVVAAALGIPALVSLTKSDAGGAESAVLVVIVLLLTVAAVARVTRALREHARSEARMAHEASHDQLTGLANRAFVLEHLGRTVRQVRDGHSLGLAVLFLDIDRFKLVNDTGGHSLGDELLVAVANRLQGHVRAQDVVARIGGDEFVLVLNSATERSEALRAAERLRLCFQVPFQLRGTNIFTSASLGVVFADADHAYQEAEAMIRDADTAMYQAKAAGRDGVAVFDASMRDRVAERLLLEQDLRVALEHDELKVHFQPIVRLSSERVDGFEALVRWAHPERGMVPPVTFIPIAEETGLIVDIGAWVLGQAVEQLAHWRATRPDGGSLQVAVNLSARQLRDPRLQSQVAEVLERHQLPGQALCLELTESLLMEDPTAASETLRRLRSLGVRLSIDDFGTGYSSLSYLKRFPVDYVKIDRSFVEGLGAPDTSEESLVAAIIAMARALGMSTVAEGVEELAQADRLHQLQADRAQGYLYSRPLEPDAVPAVLDRLGVAAYVPTPPVSSGERRRSEIVSPT